VSPSFLAENAGDVRGRVLEVGDNAYPLRFGGVRVERSDILHVDATNSRATFIGGLARVDAPPAAFDCTVLTQTLHGARQSQHCTRRSNPAESF
jgi:hypothetical protein